MKSLSTLLQMRPFEGYLYAYPHKTAYRKFSEPISLEDAWQGESMERLFLYIHIPFCEMRCGFCNLFTLNGKVVDKVGPYLSALEREAKAVQSILPQAKFSQIAIGGGTPTFLNIDELDVLFNVIGQLSPERCPTSIETSPGRTTPAHLKLLETQGIDRISLGVESFSQRSLKALGRPEKAELSIKALDNIRLLTQANLNIDLIYGHRGQTAQDFQVDIQRALEWEPEEVFLYPLYVGNLTGLARTRTEDKNWDEQRLRLYRHGRNILLTAGYHQVSQRKFLKRPTNLIAYSCQEDGMIGLGAGARSYTRGLHYSWDYAVGRAAIGGIVDQYSAHQDFSKIHYGVRLSDEEEQRRYIIKSILNTEGLDLARFKDRFGLDAITTYTEIQILLEGSYLVENRSHLKPTTLGLERADAMGPFLISETIEQSMRSYKWA